MLVVKHKMPQCVQYTELLTVQCHIQEEFCHYGSLISCFQAYVPVPFRNEQQVFI